MLNLLLALVCSGLIAWGVRLYRNIDWDTVPERWAKPVTTGLIVLNVGIAVLNYVIAGLVFSSGAWI